MTPTVTSSTTRTLYLKWVRRGRVPSYQGGAPIPYRRWTDRVVDPALCERGWHACRWPDAVHHISDELWVCELDGRIVDGRNKVVAERLRLVRKVAGINERTLRLFAADCAERVLPIFEAEWPDDDRPRLAIAAARDLAEGRISRQQAAAAGDAARSAAWDAAGDAAWAAGRAAAAGTAGTAARVAAWAAGRAAAGAARGAGAWQTDRLLVHYGGLDPDDFVGGANPTTPDPNNKEHTP